MPDPKHIVFIHGVADISKQWHRARSFFETHGFAVHFYDYRTLQNDLDIPAIANELIEFIKKNVGPANYRIFAHSQGGLVAEWFDLFNKDRNLKRIVTIGTPFQGNTLPLIAPKSVLRRLPVGRKQVADLACMSPVISDLIRSRIKSRQYGTSYISLISHSAKILNIQSDGLVSVCSGNRNADYYVTDERNIHQLPQPVSTPVAYVKTNHLPVSMVRSLQPSRFPNPFSTLLLASLNGETISAYDTFTPTQCAFVFPALLKEKLQFSENLKKIISRPTQDGKYIVFYCNVRSNEPFVRIDEQRIRLQPGKFTYLFESTFLNTKT